jgi:hypothetical protein
VGFGQATAAVLPIMDKPRMNPGKNASGTKAFFSKSTQPSPPVPALSTHSLPLAQRGENRLALHESRDLSFKTVKGKCHSSLGVAQLASQRGLPIRLSHRHVIVLSPMHLQRSSFHTGPSG